jgi:anti-sigma factor (TIGR02949 family)
LVVVVPHHGECANIVRLLADFLEGQLPHDVHQRLEQHLARCPECVAQLKTYRSTVTLLRTIREEDLPAELRWTLRSFVDKSCRN